MKNIYIFFVVLFSAICSTNAQVIVDYNHVRDLSVQQVDSILGGNAIFGVALYNVIYTILDHNEELDTVSGLYLTPLNPLVESNLVVYCHGTSNSPNDVPTNFGQGFPDALSFATSGYTVAATDYIGLGSAANSFHPYIHAESEALSALYFIDIAYEISDEIDVTVGPELFVAGYSQGGHSSMALQKMIETEFQDDLEITAAAHGSGPYSVSEVMRKLIISGEEYLPVGFIPFLILGYQEAYGNIYNELSDIFKPSYIGLIQQFEAGNLDLTTLTVQLAFTLFFEGQTIAPRYILQDTIVQRLEANDPNDPLIAALRENDTYNFEAKVPTRLYYCTADDIVPFENSIFADSAMQVLGADDLIAIDVNPNAGHGDCALGALPMAIDFFNSFIQVGVADQQADLVDQFFPNPTRDFLYLDMKSVSGVYHYHIMDYQGRLIRTGQSELSRCEIDLIDLSPGSYFIQLISDNQIQSLPFVKM